MSRLRTLPVVFAVLIALALGACGDSENGNTIATNDPTTTKATTATTAADGTASTKADGPPRAGATVSLKNLKFIPDEVSIKKGETVTWKWDEKVLHNVTSKDGDDLKSGNEDSGTYKHTFTETGEFEYECTLHSGMEGKVEVK